MNPHSEIAIIAALSGVTLGWFLNVLQSLWLTRIENIRIRNTVISNLLEIRHVLSKLSGLRLFVDVLIDTVCRISDDSFAVNQVEVNMLMQHMVALFREGIKEFPMEPFKTSFAVAIDSLAKIDPILSYQLRGQERKLVMDETLDNWLARYTETMMEHTVSEQRDQLSQYGEIVKSYLFKQGLEEIDDNILVLAKRNGYFPHKRLKRYLKDLNEDKKKEIQGEVEELFRQTLPGLNLEKQDSVGRATSPN